MSYTFDVVKAVLLDSYPYAETLIQSELETLTGVDISSTLKEQWRIGQYKWGEISFLRTEAWRRKNSFGLLILSCFFPL